MEYLCANLHTWHFGTWDDRLVASHNLPCRGEGHEYHRRQDRFRTATSHPHWIDARKLRDQSPDCVRVLPLGIAARQQDQHCLRPPQRYGAQGPWYVVEGQRTAADHGTGSNLPPVYETRTGPKYTAAEI